MNKTALSFLIIGTFLSGCLQQKVDKEDIRYDISFPNAEHNEAEITLTLSDLDPVPVQFSMSRTSPGRYALHEFAKNVYNVVATDSEGDTLEVHRPNLHNWIVNGHDGVIHFNYTLYADHADGTYSGVNREHAHLNIPASLIWAQGLNDQPITVKFHPPQGSNWRVATQLKPTDEPYTFTTPGFYYLMDSPTELSDFDLREWQVADDTTQYTIRLAVHHNGSEESLDNYIGMAKKVVAEQIAVYGEPPAYDYGTYTFIADYLPYVFGDGMEHRNSTILTSTRSLEDNALRNLYTLSHEYFHGWNVERIRPKTLEPFNFLEANVSDALWFAEGFTSYYDDLIIRRTGLLTDKEYARGWGGTLNYVLNSTGSNYYSPAEMSMQAPFVDAATSVDQQNKSNTFISYYSWGAVLGLGLDLMLRSEFEDVTLDDYMRRVWQKYGTTEMPYTLGDLQLTLAEVTDSTEFADAFFQKHVHDSQMPDLKPLLANAGFHLRKENPGQAIMSFGGNKVSFESGEATISENTVVGSPLYKAGADRGDILLSLDGRPINNARDIQRILASKKPGDVISISYESLGEIYEKTMILTEDPTLEVVPFEEIDMPLTDEAKSFRESWLESKVE
ncbi:MAG: PDZ domain-containing protein [Balneolaceae bacterium]|nr:PDZ domain-containing protein [Balneolaceae bacterium]